MKHIFAFLLLLFPFVSFANDIASMSADNVIAIFDETLPFIEERIKKINPDLVAKMANAENMDKIYEYKNFMVHYVFDEKVAQYVDMLYKHCESVGCKITHKTFSNDVEGWYIEQSDPYAKEPTCYKDGTPSSERICPWPKNYDFSSMQLWQNHFEGILDDLNKVHVYTLSMADEQGDIILEVFETSWSHQEQIEYENKIIYCNSEERPYVRAYKECIARDPEPNPYYKRCQDEYITNWTISEHDKCLGEHYVPAAITSGGIFRTFKNW